MSSLSAPLTVIKEKKIMSSIPQRLSELRREMKARSIDIYVVPTADYHGSEYVGEHFKARQFITGFVQARWLYYSLIDLWGYR